MGQISNKLDLPGLAYLEHEVFAELKNSRAWAQAASRVEERYSMPSGSLGNGGFRQTRTLSLIYCLILVPKEMFEKDLLMSDAVLAAGNLWLGQLAEVDAVGFKDWDVARLLVHLRHSVAHADYEFFDDAISFENKKIKEQVTFSMTALEAFLGTVGPAVANAALDLKKVVNQ